MWIFLATEVMFFGGLFCAYLIYRRGTSAISAPPASPSNATLGGDQYRGPDLQQLDRRPRDLGRADRAPRAAVRQPRPHDALRLRLSRHQGHRIHRQIRRAPRSRRIFQFDHVPIPGHPDQYANPRHAQIFFALYFIMTGLHALHMIIGLGIFTWLFCMAWKGRFTPEYHTPWKSAALLALCRYCLDLSVPVAVPDRPAPVRLCSCLNTQNHRR